MTFTKMRTYTTHPRHHHSHQCPHQPPCGALGSQLSNSKFLDHHSPLLLNPLSDALVNSHDCLQQTSLVLLKAGHKQVVLRQIPSSGEQAGGR